METMRPREWLALRVPVEVMAEAGFEFGHWCLDQRQVVICLCMLRLSLYHEV